MRLTQKQYAKRIGKSAPYVNKLKAQGKLAIVDGLVDVKRSDAMLKAWARPGATTSKRKSAKKPAARRGRKAQPAPPRPRSTGRPARAVRETATGTLTAERAKREKYQALNAELEYRHKIGELLPKAEVLEAERMKNTNIRRRFRELARALAPMCENRTAAEIERVIITEVDFQLGELAADPLGTVEAVPTEVEAPAVVQTSAVNLEGGAE